MKKLFIVLLFLILSWSVVGAAVDTHYVTQGGAGGHDGTSLGNAFSVSNFNTSSNWDSDVADDNKIGPGDTVYFSDTISSEVQPPAGVNGTAGNYITLDGYEAGDCEPLSVTCSSSAVLTNETDSMHLDDGGPDYFIIQDFRFTGRLRIQDWDTANQSSYIIIRRNYFADANVNWLIIDGQLGASSTYITVEENLFKDFCDTDEAAQGINLQSITHLIFRNNKVIGDTDSTHACSPQTANNIEVHDVQYAIFEYNDISYAPDQSGIAIKELDDDPNYDIIVRFNKFHNNGTIVDNGRGIALTQNIGTSNHDIYIYGNFVYSNADFGIDIHRGNYLIHVWSNIIVNNDRNGIIMWTAGGHDPEDQIYLYNNTIVNNETDEAGSTEEDRTGIGIREGSATNVYIKNNLLMNNRPNATSYQQWASHSTISAGRSDYNTLYYAGQTANYYYDSALRSRATMQGTYGLETNSNITDPGFSDADGADDTIGTVDDDFSLDGTSIDNGVDLSNEFNVTVQGVTYYMDYEDALDPNNTNWATTPPTVSVLKQSDYGTSERGAYIYAAPPPSQQTSTVRGLRLENALIK
jgi:hypothetical protein